MKQNPLILFLVELFTRIGQKSPWFFVILQWVAGAVTAVTGLPAILDIVFRTLKYTPPAIFIDLENKTVALCGLVGLFFSLLPVQGKTEATSIDGQPLKSTNNKMLPFTAKEEEKQVKLLPPAPKVGITTKR